jgi:hypothetical protein
LTKGRRVVGHTSLIILKQYSGVFDRATPPGERRAHYTYIS